MGKHQAPNCPQSGHTAIYWQAVKHSFNKHSTQPLPFPRHCSREHSKGTRQTKIRTSLMVQWLRLCTSNAGRAGSILGRGTKIPHASWQGQKKKTDKNPRAPSPSSATFLFQGLALPQTVKFPTSQNCGEK